MAYLNHIIASTCIMLLLGELYFGNWKKVLTKLNKMTLPHSSFYAAQAIIISKTFIFMLENTYVLHRASYTKIAFVFVSYTTINPFTCRYPIPPWFLAPQKILISFSEDIQRKNYSLQIPLKMSKVNFMGVSEGKGTDMK